MMDLTLSSNDDDCDLVSKNSFAEHLENEYIHPSATAFPPFYLCLEDGPSKVEENIYETIQEPDSKLLFIGIVLVVIILLATTTTIVVLFFLKQPTTSTSKDPILSLCSNTNSTECRADFIRNMTRNAWTAYRTYAWGHVALKPAAKYYDDLDFGFYSGATIIAAMSTLHVMGLEEEWIAGRKWIETEFNYSSVDQNVPVAGAFRVLFGGLLSAYALSGDLLFKTKALELAAIFEPAFHPVTGLAFHQLNPKTGRPALYDPPKKPHLPNFLADIGFEQPEYLFAARISTGNSSTKWKGRLSTVRQMMLDIEKPRGLYMNFLFVTLPKKWIGTKTAVSYYTPSFYYNMLRSYLLSGRTDVEMLKMYSEAVDAMWRNGVFRVLESGRIFTSVYDLKTNTSEDSMANQACQAAAMLALGAKELELNGSNDSAALHWSLAINLTAFCQQTVDATEARLLPAAFNVTTWPTDSKGLIVDTLAENYFILWRLTGNNIVYREAAWQLVQALWRHCRTTSGGYTRIVNVNRIPTEAEDQQNPVFFSATLKYLYLIFVNESVLPLEKWIFNDVGHPLPISK